MPSGLSTLPRSRQTLLASFSFCSFVQASILGDLRYNYFAPAPAPEDGPAFSAHAIRNRKYLPIEIGAILGAYAVSLVAIAVGLLFLAKKRREHLLTTEEDEAEAYAAALEQICSPKFPTYPFPVDSNISPLAGDFAERQIRNFSYKSPTKSEFGGTPYIHPPISPAHSNVPGVEPLVDQSVVAADREMAQNQLEDMYKHVMEHEAAKEKGITLESPVIGPAYLHGSTQSKKSKPTDLNLNNENGNEEKTKSRTSSFFSGLRSPRKSKPKGFNISSPILTPQTGTFPRHDGQEMNAIPPRHYTPAAPPPVPAEQKRFVSQARPSGTTLPLTPGTSPGSIQSIDGRLGVPLSQIHTSKGVTPAPTEADPESAISEHSQAPLLGLPSSPKPGATFGALPLSPRPGSRFQRANVPSAVRTGGALPLRAYQPEVSSPSAPGQSTKQTVFERRGPLSPGGGRTPFTANAVPYSPYQPHTPCVPITPSLVTREDRKRMKKMVPKTPTVAMVQSTDDMW